MGIARKRILRFAGGPKTASKKLEQMKRAAARRRIKPGYPVEQPFTNVQNVREYLNADRIVCLRCGKLYKALNKHLPVHSWTVNQYKEFYGLPWGAGLVCKSSRIKWEDNGRRVMAMGKAFGGTQGGYPSNAKAQSEQVVRKLSSFALQTRDANLPKGRPTQFKSGNPYQFTVTNPNSWYSRKKRSQHQ